MAAKQPHSGNDRLHPFLEQLGPLAAQAEIFLYSVKIVCGKQTETNCCCVAGAGQAYTRPRSTFKISILSPADYQAVPAVDQLGASLGVGRAAEPLAPQTAYFARTQEHITLPCAGGDDG
jgi:hypothetical protein